MERSQRSAYGGAHRRGVKTRSRSASHADRRHPVSRDAGLPTIRQNVVALPQCRDGTTENSRQAFAVVFNSSPSNLNSHRPQRRLEVRRGNDDFSSLRFQSTKRASVAVAKHRDAPSSVGFSTCSTKMQPACPPYNTLADSFSSSARGAGLPQPRGYGLALLLMTAGIGNARCLALPDTDLLRYQPRLVQRSFPDDDHRFAGPCL